MREFVFITGNMHKLEQLEKFLGVKVGHRKLDIDELQSAVPEEVLEHKARAAFEILKKPVLVDDVSMSFHAWGDLPGTFVKFFVEGPGLEKMTRMLDGFDDRGATAKVSYGYFDGDELTIIGGEITGTIAQHPCESVTGFGYDSIFIRDGDSIPCGGMSVAEHDNEKHPRRRAVDKLKKFLEV